MNMLQELLNLGLVDIGSDDSRFAKMESAAQELVKKFADSPALMVTATLVTLDEEVPEDDPFFELVERLVIDEWKTLRNTHVNRPRELLRSIAISALFAAAADEPERSAIIWNTAASRLVHDQTSLGKAARLLQVSLEAAFASAEHEALRRAGMVAVAPKRRRRKSQTTAASDAPRFSGTIHADDVLTDVGRAAGPQYPQGTALNDANPHWTNQAQNWSHGFTPRMTDALVKAVNLGTTRLAKSIASELAAHAVAMEEHLQQQLRHVETLQSNLAESATAGRTRLDVLWWSQARYSPSQKTAYATLPAATAALAAAADLTAIVPSLAPASVTHVLGETITACFGSESLGLLEQLNLLKESAPTGLERVLPTGNTDAARVPVLELVAEVVRGSSVSETDIRTRAGVDPGLKLEPAELAMWLFREFQALRIAEGME